MNYCGKLLKETPLVFLDQNKGETSIPIRTIYTSSVRKKQKNKKQTKIQQYFIAFILTSFLLHKFYPSEFLMFSLPLLT